jgi:hypothetical protein
MIADIQSKAPPQIIAVGDPSNQHAAAATPSEIASRVTWLGVMGVR